MKTVPKTIPRGSKRKPRVTAGSANQTSTGLVGLAGDEHGERRAGPAAPPRRRRPRPPGARLLRMKRSATAKPASPSASGSTHHQPTAGAAEGERQGEDREAGGAVAAHPQLHVEQPLAARLLVDRDEGLGAMRGRRGASVASVAERLRGRVHAWPSTPRGRDLDLHTCSAIPTGPRYSTSCSSLGRALRLRWPSSVTTTRSSIRTPSSPGR